MAANETLRPSKNLNRIRHPSSQRGEGSGVRGRAWSCSPIEHFETLIPRRVWELIRHRGIPLTPSPSPALGRGVPNRSGLQVCGLENRFSETCFKREYNLPSYESALQFSLYHFRWASSRRNPSRRN